MSFKYFYNFLNFLNFFTPSDDPITFYERVRSADKLLSSSFSAGGTILAVGSSDGDIFTYTIRG